MSEFAALVLAGGQGRRLGGAAKPFLTVAGRPMVSTVLAALACAEPRIVVGGPPAPDAWPSGVHHVADEPIGAGPVGAIAAGLAQLPRTAVAVGLFAADLPLLTEAAVADLRRQASEDRGAYFVDDGGRPQWLCSIWPTRLLTNALAGLGDPTGLPVRRLLADLPAYAVHTPATPPPWYDCDTDVELAQARRWLEEGY